MPMMSLTRLIALPLVLATLSVANAQIPSAQGQMPGTLPPAPAFTPPPPPVAPAPVPSAVTPLRSPTYGVPRGVTAPTYGSGAIMGTIRSTRPPKKRFKRRPRTSEILFVRRV
jgi:hypothetical protein